MAASTAEHKMTKLSVIWPLIALLLKLCGVRLVVSHMTHFSSWFLFYFFFIFSWCYYTFRFIRRSFYYLRLISCNVNACPIGNTIILCNRLEFNAETHSCWQIGQASQLIDFVRGTIALHIFLPNWRDLALFGQILYETERCERCSMKDHAKNYYIRNCAQLYIEYRVYNFCYGIVIVWTNTACLYVQYTIQYEYYKYKWWLVIHFGCTFVMFFDIFCCYCYALWKWSSMNE